MGGEESLVLNLVIEIKNEIGSVVEELMIEPRIESDHLRVKISMGRKESTRGIKEEAKEKKEYRLKWEKEMEE